MAAARNPDDADTAVAVNWRRRAALGTRPTVKDSRNVLEEYVREAPELVESFEAILSSDVYAHVAHLLPAQPARIVDVGMGHLPPVMILRAD